MKKFIHIFCLIIAISPAYLYAENPDALYKDGKYAEAQKSYEKGDIENPRDLRYRYDKACSAYQNNDYKIAAEAFTSVLRRAKDKEMLFRSAYNLGNIAFKSNDFSTAIEFYKQAIAQKPESTEAKYNLELSLKKLEEQKNNKDNKDKKDDKNKDSKDKNDKEKQDKNKDKQDKKDQQNQNAGDDKQKQENAAVAVDKQKAQALLDNIKENPAKIMQYRIPQDKKAESGKTW